MINQSPSQALSSRHDIAEFLGWLKKYSAKHVEILKIYLFGSFARGDASTVSDIDLAFSLSDPSEWGVIAQDIRETAKTLKKLDMVCLEKVSPNFKKKIVQEGMVVYEKS